MHSSLDNAEQLLPLSPVRILAALRPTGGHVQRTADIVVIGHGRRALVKAHDDVGAKRFLYLNRQFRCQKMIGSIQVGLELDAFFADLAQFAQAEYLKSAAVGQNRPLPVHETVQTAQLLHQMMTRAQIKVIGVGQDDLGIDRQQVFRSHGLDRGICSHRHENRSFDLAVGCFQRTGAGSAGTILVNNCK